VSVVEVSVRMVARDARSRQKTALAVVYVVGLGSVVVAGQTAAGVGVIAGAAVAVAIAEAVEVAGIVGTETEATGEQKCRRESG